MGVYLPKVDPHSNTEPMQTNRLEHFDLLRGVAILLVVMGHIIYFSIEQPSILPYKVIEDLHMPLFVFCSGYFATHPIKTSLESVRRYWQSKVIRLLLPLLIFPALLGWIKRGFSPMISIKMCMEEYWFTGALFCMFLLFYAFRYTSRLLFAQRKPVFDSLWIVLSIGVLYIIQGAMFRYVGLNIVNGLFRNLTWLYPYFVLGYFVGKYPSWDRFFRKDWIVASCLLAYGALLYLEFDLGFQVLENSRVMTLLLLIFSYGLAIQVVDYVRSRQNSLSLVILGWIDSFSSVRSLCRSISSITFSCPMGCGCEHSSRGLIAENYSLAGN